MYQQKDVQSLPPTHIYFEDVADAYYKYVPLYLFPCLLSQYSAVSV